MRKTSSASRKEQETYDGFIRDVGSTNVGELHLEQAENARAVKVRLRRASKRLGIDIEIWDNDGKVYFKSAVQAPRRRRSARSSK
jgi:hypothetical protein